MPLLDNVKKVYKGTVPVMRMMRNGGEVWPKVPVKIAASSSLWDRTHITITPPMVPADSYSLYRDGALIYSGGLQTEHDDYNLWGYVTYTYKVDAIRGGVVSSSATTQVTTPGRADIGTYYTDLYYGGVIVRWSDPQQGSVNQYDTYLNGVYQETSWNDDHASGMGCAENTGYEAMVVSYRAGQEVGPRGYTWFTTPTRPQGTGTLWGYGSGQYTWSECTQVGLWAADFDMGVDGWVTGFNMNVSGYSPDGGRFNPDIDGALFGWRPACCGACGYPTSCLAWVGLGTWQDRNGHHAGGGSHHLGTSVAGDCNKTQWYVCCGRGYSDKSIHWGQLDYWWYSAMAMNLEMQREQPWWNEVIVNREIHIDQWQDFQGRPVAVKVKDRWTDEPLIDWGRVPRKRRMAGGRPPEFPDEKDRPEQQEWRERHERRGKAGCS